MMMSIMIRLRVGIGLAGKGAPDVARLVLVGNVFDRRVCSGAQDNHADDEDKQVQGAESNVLGRRVPAALLDELEPEEGRPVEGEARDEERRDETKQGVEEGDGLSNDPSKDGAGRDEADPDGPAACILDETDGRVGEHTVHDVATDDGAVDGTRDEDDWKSNTKGNARDGVASRKQGRRLDALANKGVDESTRDGVDEDFNQTKGPDGLDVVLGGVHLRHEGELAHGKRVGKDDVGGSKEGLVEGGSGLGPGGPVDGAEATGLVVRLDASRNNGDHDGGNDADKVDVSQKGKVVERGGQRKDQEDDEGNDAPDKRARLEIARDVDKGNGSREGVGSNEQNQEEGKHDTSQFASKGAPDEGHGIRVVVDVGVAHLDLADHVRRVNGHETKANTEEDTGNHAEGSKGAGDTEGAQGNGLDNQADGQLLPAQTVELFRALLDRGRLVDGHHELGVALAAVGGEVVKAVLGGRGVLGAGRVGVVRYLLHGGRGLGGGLRVERNAIYSLWSRAVCGRRWRRRRKRGGAGVV